MFDSGGGEEGLGECYAGGGDYFPQGTAGGRKEGSRYHSWVSQQEEG